MSETLRYDPEMPVPWYVYTEPANRRPVDEALRFAPHAPPDFESPETWGNALSANFGCTTETIWDSPGALAPAHQIRAAQSMLPENQLLADELREAHGRRRVARNDKIEKAADGFDWALERRHVKAKQWRRQMDENIEAAKSELVFRELYPVPSAGEPSGPSAERVAKRIRELREELAAFLAEGHDR